MAIVQGSRFKNDPSSVYLYIEERLILNKLMSFYLNIISQCMSGGFNYDKKHAISLS